MKISNQLYLGFSAVIAILIIITVVSVFKVNTIDTALQTNSQEHSQIQRYAINFRGSAHDRAIAIRDVVLSKNEDKLNIEIKLIEKLSAFYSDSEISLLKLINAKDSNPQLKILYKNIKDIENEAVAITNEIIELVKVGSQTNIIKAETLLWNEAKNMYINWLAAINKLIDYEEELIKASNDIALKESNSFMFAMLLSLAIGVALAIISATLVKRSILNRLGSEPSDLTLVAQKVSKGDLSNTICKTFNFRKNSVLADLRSMQDDLALVVANARRASHTVAQDATLVAKHNMELLSGINEQNNMLEQTSSAVVEITQTARNTSDLTRQATQLATNSSDAASVGGADIKKIHSMMNDITESSTKMTEIVNVIDGIAFQTNILALNAAVEAARAGESGRGFAVVAGEVRALAQRSASAAREIKELIEESSEKIFAGDELVTNTQETMVDIVDQAKQVAVLISEISTAADEQTRGIELINDSIKQIDTISTQNSNVINESAKAVTVMQEQANGLIQSMSNFTLDEIVYAETTEILDGVTNALK